MQHGERCLNALDGMPAVFYLCLPAGGNAVVRRGLIYVSNGAQQEAGHRNSTSCYVECATRSSHRHHQDGTTARTCSRSNIDLVRRASSSKKRILDYAANKFRNQIVPVVSRPIPPQSKSKPSFGLRNYFSRNTSNQSASSIQLLIQDSQCQGLLSG